jgi:hypothetical protein
VWERFVWARPSAVQRSERAFGRKRIRSRRIGFTEIGSKATAVVPRADRKLGGISRAGVPAPHSQIRSRRKPPLTTVGQIDS